MSRWLIASGIDPTSNEGQGESHKQEEVPNENQYEGTNQKKFWEDYDKNTRLSR